MLRVAADHVGELFQVISLIECFIDEPDWFKCDFFNKLNEHRFKPSLGNFWRFQS
ncbi:unnamed protein product [Strongylus vulgaris]|uniref:Uncharacterized protein n=1 Tax=Strongylus vulgaris TaxID=40348 RepID=A0A3P7JJK7_STRVU|nr:unnamed protein product [Strongylus vulgaris]